MTDPVSALADDIGVRLPPDRARPIEPVDDAEMRLVGQFAKLFVKQGNMAAAEFMRRLWQARSDRVEIDLPPCDDLDGVVAAHAAVIRQAAAGRLDLRQAQLLSRLLLNQGRALGRRLEFEGFAERIAEIEAANRAEAEAQEARNAALADAEALASAMTGGSPGSAVPAARLSPCRPPPPTHYPWEMAGASGGAVMTAPPPD
jgi:hypothetical protein